MATSSPVSPDTLITIKVQTGGENRRFKLPLKDLGPNTLPQRLRNFLAVSDEKAVVLERYSDSASSYVKLDVNNIAVFKQLHRAAKAKLKLRIKATVLDVQDDNNSATPTAQAMPASTPMPLELAQAQMKAIKASLHAQQQYQQDLLKNLQPQQVAQEIQSQPTTHQLQDYQTQLELLEQADTKCRLLESEHVASAAAEPQRLTEAEQDYHMQLMLLEQQNKRRLLMARARAASASRAERQKESEQEGPFGGPFAQFSVCCNSCNNDIPGVHWHCSICVEGDYDLCQDCVEDGQHCHVDHHFLIKRHIENGRVISSTIEMAPKRSLETGMTAEPEVKVEIKSEAAELPLQALPKEIPSTSEDYEVEQEEPLDGSRTCNACVSIFPEQLFVTCLDCEDYDLCMSCHVSNEHGHHPAHEFSPISEVDTLGYKAKALCAPGRNVHHQAICDGCDKSIVGVRHKCLACPDFDYCAACVQSAQIIHPGHRFAPIYETLAGPSASQPIHFGVCCDGPLCRNLPSRSYISGDRYKCAVCHDTDFCAKCEALPTSSHNRTHPLIKFRSPVRNCSVTTFDETVGSFTPVTLGDRSPQVQSRSTETMPAALSANAATQVQTVAEIKPVETKQPVRAASPIRHQAIFVRDSVTDGTAMPTNTIFEQVWTMRNPGPNDWPAGCSLACTGGDRMLNIDSNNPGSISDLDKALSSKPIDHVVKAGEEVSVAVTLRTPSRSGNYIGYWRLRSPEGIPFGHRLWCDIHAIAPPASPVMPKTDVNEAESVQAPEESLRESQMVFPTLEKESPYSSLHDDASHVPAAPSSISPEDQDFLDDVESLGLEDETTDDGFLTDEEYEILDSDSQNGAAHNGRA